MIEKDCQGNHAELEEIKKKLSELRVSYKKHNELIKSSNEFVSSVAERTLPKLVEDIAELEDELQYEQLAKGTVPLSPDEIILSEEQQFYFNKIPDWHRYALINWPVTIPDVEHSLFGEIITNSSCLSGLELSETRFVVNSTAINEGLELIVQNNREAVELWNSYLSNREKFFSKDMTTSDSHKVACIVFPLLTYKKIGRNLEDCISHSDELITMEKLGKIIGNNHFFNDKAIDLIKVVLQRYDSRHLKGKTSSEVYTSATKTATEMKYQRWNEKIIELGRTGKYRFKVAACRKIAADEGGEVSPEHIRDSTPITPEKYKSLRKTQ